MPPGAKCKHLSFYAEKIALEDRLCLQNFPEGGGGGSRVISSLQSIFINDIKFELICVLNVLCDLEPFALKW